MAALEFLEFVTVFWFHSKGPNGASMPAMYLFFLDGIQFLRSPRHLVITLIKWCFLHPAGYLDSGMVSEQKCSTFFVPQKVSGNFTTRTLST